MTDFSEAGRIARECATPVRLVGPGTEVLGWSKSLWSPAPHYLETSSGGPYTLKETVAIEINPIELRRRGVRLPPVAIDRSEELAAKLSAAGIASERTAEGLFRVEVSGASAVG